MALGENLEADFIRHSSLLVFYSVNFEPFVPIVDGDRQWTFRLCPGQPLQLWVLLRGLACGLLPTELGIAHLQIRNP